jgi:hypothetical protein
MYNACLSFDHTQVICDYGIYNLTGDELADPENAVQTGALKCKAAYDAQWYENKRWDEVLTASTTLENNQEQSR